MKRSFLLSIALFYCIAIFAQNDLIIQSNNKGLYLAHVVTPKQNFYSIGRLYNVSPKEIASFNNLDMTKGLVIGQTLMIPLNSKNFNQSKNSGRPVYYTVEEKEGLYKISNKNNKVLMANLRNWNKLNNDNLSAGEKLIVGYLVSPQANNIIVANAVSLNQAPQQVEPPLKEDPKKDIAIQKKETIEKKDDIIPQKEIQEKHINSMIQKTSSTQSAVVDGSGGYFRTQFDQQVKVQPLKAEMTATAGIFKTASGWQDGKYYVLMDNIDPGTIVRVVNPSNNRIVYAKVLGSMNGIRQNQGYDVRISNAAASALEISESDKFILKVLY
jgi:LysM repeat protein